MATSEGTTLARRTEEPAHHREIGPDESISTAVVAAVASVKDVDRLDLDPLQHYVDADALNALESSIEHDDGTGWVLAFEYEGREVFVRRGQEVTVR